MIVKGTQRHSVYLGMTSSQWPLVKQAFEEWLDDKNFEGEGQQIRSLAAIREGLKVASSSDAASS